ncbi:hypothetical protein ACQ4M4_19855 [Leptolyngbya sp. AN02str]|uniref:hypothetical protein n=1 Tax=Leptolyngbya sp. AN02str TaxID=3423363 RepID=UPI003D315645
MSKRLYRLIRDNTKSGVLESEHRFFISNGQSSDRPSFLASTRAAIAMSMKTAIAGKTSGTHLRSQTGNRAHTRFPVSFERFHLGNDLPGKVRWKSVKN